MSSSLSIAFSRSSAELAWNHHVHWWNPMKIHNFCLWTPHGLGSSAGETETDHGPVPGVLEKPWQGCINPGAGQSRFKSLGLGNWCVFLQKEYLSVDTYLHIPIRRHIYIYICVYVCLYYIHIYIYVYLYIYILYSSMFIYIYILYLYIYRERNRHEGPRVAIWKDPPWFSRFPASSRSVAATLNPLQVWSWWSWSPPDGLRKPWDTNGILVVYYDILVVLISY